MSFSFLISQCSILFLYSIVGVRCQAFSVNAYKSEVFIEKISPDRLSWNSTELENDFHYVVTSSDGPDLPPWIYTKFVPNSNGLYIFGAAPKDIEINSLEVQISVTSLHSYRVKYCKLNILVNPREEYAKYEIRLRISNVNIETMLDITRQREFLDIFETHFWAESRNRLYITFITESQYAGFRLPLNPNDTTGVVIHLGSSSNFSVQLYDLQNETKPLSKHCPKFTKRITVERYFRPKNFIIDWCFFKLINIEECQLSSTETEANITGELCVPTSSNKSVDLILQSEEDFLIDKEKLPESPVFGMLILLVIIPSIFLGFIIASWLASFMCINNEKLTTNSNEEQMYENNATDQNQVLFHF